MTNLPTNTVDIERRSLTNKSNKSTLVGKPCGKENKMLGVKKSVQFSSVHEITYVERIDLEDPSKLWYSQEEVISLKQANMRAVNTLYLQLSSSSDSSSVVDDEDKILDMMTGIETFLFVEEVTKCRSQCVNAVFDEQEHQDDLGICNPERIARASRQYSRMATQRAYNIGCHQSKF